jgi:hypothetical protein
MRRGQSILEFSLVICALVAAFIGMQIYMKRGMQGRLRSLADEMGQQYDPGSAQSNIVTTQTGTATTTSTTTTVGSGSETTTETTSDMTETRVGAEKVGN